MHSFSPKQSALLVCSVLFSLSACNNIERTALQEPGSFEGKTSIISAIEHPIPQPEVINSVNGLLDITLDAAPAKITVAGHTFLSNVYNGSYLAPVLKAQRGDKLRIKLVNNIGPADIMISKPQATNLHYHGMNIPPQEPLAIMFLC